MLIPLVVIPQVMAAPVYPLKKSASGRYLVDQNNVPFLLVADTAWSLMVNISEADAATYFANRQANGFNGVMMSLVVGTYTAGRADGSTYDGITPFTANNSGKTTYDLTTPRETYFAHADRIINLAASYGLVVFIDPLDTGSYYRTEGTPTMQDNGTAKCRAYGQYVGNRYKNFPNIVWQHGNDDDYTAQTAGSDQYTLQIAGGILDYDTNHLHTIELGAPQGSYDDPAWRPIIGLNAAYTWDPTYDEVLVQYNAASLPVFVVEDHYEDETMGWPPDHNNSDTGTPLVNRRQDYWTILSGATGKHYGNHAIWRFDSGWQNHLNTQCVTELGYMKALFAPRQWWNLVPDQAHTVVTAGYGTYAATGKVSQNDYATAARSTDGSFVMAYLPTSRQITVDMTKLGGTVTARWYDPTNGTYSAIVGSPFANTGTHDLTAPGNNSAGDSDWVLVLEATAAPTFTLQPASQTANAGASVTFTAAASGSPSPTYQWQKNSVNLAGATSASYTIASAAAGDAGTYTVVATNSAGSATSNGAVLSVNVPPTNIQVEVQIH